MKYSLSHYAELIKVYGPPVTYWTARFESKHRIAKESIKYTDIIKLL